MDGSDEQHDLSDDSDYAASQQQGLRESVHYKSVEDDRFDENDTSETLYLKENVAVHPTQHVAERISGQLRLLKQHSSLFLRWLPYVDVPNEENSTNSTGNLANSILTKDKLLYAINDLSMNDVRSLHRHSPPFGWQYIIIVLSSGLAYPPLYFYSGGVREFLTTLKQHVIIVRSAEDFNIFLLNDFRDPLQPENKTRESEDQVVVYVVDLSPYAEGRNISSPFYWKEILGASWHRSEKDLSCQNNLEGIMPPRRVYERRNTERSLLSFELPRAISISKAGPVQNTSSAYSVEGSSGSEYHEMRTTMLKHPSRDISLHVLEKFSLITRFARDATSEIFHEHRNRSLRNYEKLHEDNSSSSYETISSDEIFVPSDPLKFDSSQVMEELRQDPLEAEEWAAFLDSEGRIKDFKSLRKRIFYGGVGSNLRKEVWKFLLGYHLHNSTYEEREYIDSIKKSEFESLKSQWQSISTTQAKRFTKFRERRSLIEKDVVRTDTSVPYYDGDDNPHVKLLHDILLTYSFYNFDLGYCQGMSDLLSPVLFVIEDESESFWCFVALMERLGPNFNRDQSGLHSQLFALSKLVELLDRPLHDYLAQADCLNYYYCFRWILIQFKREFEHEQLMRLWEVLWTHYKSEHFHLYVCVAILKRYRREIMGQRMGFDSLLKFINELSGKLVVDDILWAAESLCNFAGEKGEACIPPGTPPSLSTDAFLDLYCDV